MSAGHKKPEWAQSKREKENAQRIERGEKPKRRWGPWVFLGIVVIGIGGYVVLRPTPKDTAPSGEAQAVVKQLLPSEIMTIAPERLTQTVKVTGSLVPDEEAQVASQVSGQVLKIMVRPGEAVSKGDVLFEIDKEPFEIALNQQKATANATRVQLANSRQQLERTQELARRELASPSSLEEAQSSTDALEANLAALESAVDSAELSLRNTIVRAPISGIISSRSIELGQTISAGAVVFEIADLSTMEFQASASVSSSTLVMPEQVVKISVNGLDDATFDGTVSRINPVASEGTRAVPIYIEVPNTENRLRGGMFATGFITVDEKDSGIGVPPDAILEDADGEYVLELNNGTLERKGIETVRSWGRGALVEVTGLVAGETIVSAALTELTAGDSYELIEE